ncbi:MAG TPA: class I SAM-dependent methyltransferase, partial [Candidatus Paceibacterota bacterium]|nr:class I SAM-dependent methyltransferase [Candidatus Paceibacterota bacterium]
MNKFDSLRPKNLYDDVLAQRKLDGTEFFRLYADKFVDVRCLACNADGSFEFHKWGFSHKRCQNCSTLYVSPRPKEDLLISYYNDFKSPNMWTRLLLSADTERKKLQYQPRAELILSLTKLDKNKNAVIVDVGAGSGAFCLAMKSTGMFNKVVALDIADEALEACEKNGLDTIKGMISDAETSSADLITVNDLIEHLFNPKEFLIDSLRVLKAGGYI